MFRQTSNILPNTRLIKKRDALKVKAVDGRLTSHSGAVLLRDFDHRLGLTESLADQLIDPRRQDRVRYQGVELRRERIYAMALGESDQDDLDRLAHDPAMKMAAWDRPGEEVLNQRLASQPTQSRLIDWLADCPKPPGFFAWGPKQVGEDKKGSEPCGALPPASDPTPALGLLPSRALSSSWVRQSSAL